MEWFLVDPKTLDFGNLTPVFWTFVFCGCLLIITLVGICCASCCLCCRRRRQRKIQRRLSASSTLFPEDMEISSVLLRPPPVNPDYTPTPRPIRFPQSRHYQQYFQTEQSPTETLDDRIIRNPGTVPSSTTAEVSLPPTDSAPPSYTEAVKMTSPYSSPTQAVSSKSQVSPASPPENNRGSYVTSTGILEPSAPYPTLPYVTNK